MIKVCPKCKEEKEWHESGKTGCCKECQNQGSSVYRYSSREAINSQRGGARGAVRELVNGYKESRGCVDCPPEERHPHYLLDFDHLDADTKVSSISRMITDQISIQKIFIEIKKCEVVCKNHHAIRTHNRRHV